MSRYIWPWIQLLCPLTWRDEAELGPGQQLGVVTLNVAGADEHVVLALPVVLIGQPAWCGFREQIRSDPVRSGKIQG